MLDIEKDVKEIRLYKNALVSNEHHEIIHLTKKYMEIEFFNGKIIKLDPIAGADITDSDYLKVIDKGRLAKKIYRSNLLGPQ